MDGGIGPILLIALVVVVVAASFVVVVLGAVFVAYGILGAFWISNTIGNRVERADAADAEGEVW